MSKQKKSRQQPPVKKRARFAGPLRQLAFGVIVTVGLVCLKLYVESIPLGHRIELLTYEFLHGQMAPFSSEIEMPVVVLDISQIPGGKGNETTSRDSLKEIITELVNQNPRAIAVDIDFSPTDAGWVDKKDPAFFEFCLEQRARGVPVLLGVFRRASEKPAAWLGSEDFKELAADITINTEDTSRLRLWVQNGEQERLPSVSAALLKATGVSLPQPPRWLKFALQDYEHVERNNRNEVLQSAYMLVNYSKLEAIESQSLPAISSQSIRDLGEKFRNKLVIVGDGQYGHATDLFVIPGRTVAIPGVYLHASGVYSLTVEPFYELKHSVRLLIDFLMALVILLSVTIIRLKKRDENFDWHRAQKRFIWIAVLLALVLGIVAVRSLNVLWLDFCLVIFALLLHPAVEAGALRLFQARHKSHDG